MSIKFTDRAQIGGLKETGDGYLVATSRVARTGVQLYRASELGDAAADRDPDSVVKVYRHADQVFAPDTLNSITRVPVTLEHPPVMVDADNWKQYAVGEVGDAYAKDGEWIVVNPMIKDSAARLAAASTHKEISMGYGAEIVPARDGVDADFEMVNIRMNHLALVPQGRAGSQARIGDAQWGAFPLTVEDTKMAELKTVVLGDKAVQVEAKDAETVAAILKDHKTLIDAKDAEIGELKAKLADAESKVLDDDDIAALIEAKVAYNAKLEAVKAKFGDAAIEGASEAMIEGMYRVIDKAVDDTARKVIGDKKSVKVDDSDDLIKAAQMKFLKGGK